MSLKYVINIMLNVKRLRDKLMEALNSPVKIISKTVEHAEYGAT